MGKRWLLPIVALCVLVGGSSAYADEATKRPLDDIFDELVIVPYDYQGKAFVRGQKTDIYGEYEMVQRDNRVLVPIRLMGDLASAVAPWSPERGSWQVNWDAQRPNEVLIFNAAQSKTILLTVNSKTMLVNKQPVALDVPPQKINGRIMLPLRSAATALGTKIDWLDGLILLGDRSADLAHPRTLAVKDAIRRQLSDSRERVAYTEKALRPLAKSGNAVYYVKSVYDDKGGTELLYRKVEGQKESKVQVPGVPSFSTGKIIGDDYYFYTKVDGRAELHAYDFAKQEHRRVASLAPWDPGEGWGWLDDVMFIDGELYVNLHTGDLTMGSEILYKVENGVIRKVLSAKSLIQLAKDGNELYYTDSSFMGNMQNNLSRIDATTGEETIVGESGYTYGIYRSIRGDGVSYGGNGSLYAKDGFVYSLGYKESDPKDVSAVYRIDAAAGTQAKLTAPAKQFWMFDDRIYYIDEATSALHRVDADGSNLTVVSEEAASDVRFHNGSVYFVAGGLQRYDPATGKRTELSAGPIASYWTGEAGVYFTSQGYEPGLFTIEADGRHTSLVKDNVDQAVLTDAGMVYTLVYKDGVYSGQ
ncbi:DUF5050 domain-containing protein [Paenibacillus sp.]|uniref:DUF5050 domain-containing protein n=1 Tax=Paenibacillus sp. TaxID=58172 RepID=UPI0028125311|nr:DUF5050 domain-containing protein [Paenibacillus sp.]